MAQLGYQFDSSQVEPREDFEALPAGSYVAQVIESEISQTKKGDGEKLSLTWEIIDGEYVGRRIWQNINLSNPNPKATEIGQRELSAVCRAVGAGVISDSEDLHWKPALLKIGVETDQNGNLRNVVKSVAAAGPAPAQPAARQQPASRPAQQQSQPAAHQRPAATTAPKPPGARPWGAR